MIASSQSFPLSKEIIFFLEENFSQNSSRERIQLEFGKSRADESSLGRPQAASG